MDRFSGLSRARPSTSESDGGGTGLRGGSARAGRLAPLARSFRSRRLSVHGYLTTCVGRSHGEDPSCYQRGARIGFAYVTALTRASWRVGVD